LSDLSRAKKILIEFFEWIEKIVERFDSGPAVCIQIKFSGGYMDSKLNVGQSVSFFITGTDANQIRTGLLATGTSLAVKVSDTTLATITPDAAPGVAPDGGPSLASGKLTALLAGTEVMTAQVTNVDGTPGPTATANVVISAAGQPGPATSIVFQFGTPA
jgi:hypothetical protein